MTDDIEVSSDTLDRTPERALALLRAAGTSMAIFSSLARKGYSKKFHQEGWNLLHAASSFTEDASLDVEENSEVKDAIAQLDGEDESLIRVMRASLRRRFPEQAKFILEGIAPTTGPAAVLVIKRVLERLDDVTARTNKKTAGEALDLLAERGIDSAKRANLAKLVRVAESAKAASAPDEESEEERAAIQDKALRELRAWYEEWSEIARVAVKRRDHLIRLGLAARRKPSHGNEGDVPDAEPPQDLAPTAAKAV